MTDRPENPDHAEAAYRSQADTDVRDPIDDDYRRAIALVEALPENRSGADKSWVFEVMEANRRHLERARRV